MKCKECGATLQTGRPYVDGLALECSACAYFPPDCTCYSRTGQTPLRWVHCLDCERLFIKQVDTTKRTWRMGEV